MNSFPRCGAVLALLFISSFALATDADAKVAIYTFAGSTDGAFPTGGLAQDLAGNLYGTTSGGGGGACGGGCGTLFQITPQGKHTVLHNFTDNADGAFPYADLISDDSGNIYGTAPGDSGSFGSVFEYSADGTFTVLHSFAGTDGSRPMGRLLLTPGGDLFSTTRVGGAHGAGTVFKLASDGTLTTLYSFQDAEDGGDPFAGVVADASGNLYGTTQSGGDPDCKCGVLFELKNGKLKVLHTFGRKRADGQQPYAALWLDDVNGLTGTTYYGGTERCRCGTIFRLGWDGTYTVLHSFARKKDGANPVGGVIADNDGNLFGTTQAGGGCRRIHSGCGTVYELSPAGVLTILHALNGNGDGYGINGQVFSSGLNLYGTAIRGGDPACGGGLGCGTVFAVQQ